jgi:5-methylthioadenosine/S-adenosylhomocysteine deaminase
VVAPDQGREDHRELMTTVFCADLTLTSPASALTPHVVAVRDDRIVEVGERENVLKRYPDARVEELPGCLLLAGFVNAHQHGRGVSQVQLGYHDDFLETWISSRRGRGILDPYPITLLAAANMLAHGVTTTIHANYTYGTGDYEAEVRASLRAYDEAGIRVTMCIGAMDRGFTVYPPHEACFLASLPADLREWLSRPGARAYAGDAAGTIALMDRLLTDYRDHPRIRLCYGPAGPQWVSDELWRALARDADRPGIGLHLHALESPAQAAAARDLYPGGVLAHLEKLGAMTPRTTIAHGIWVNDADIDIVARTGATVVRNPGCNLRLRNGIAPLARYLARGARVAIGTDNASLADDEDVLKELRLAALLARAPDWHGDAPPSTQQLLEMLTVNGSVAAQTAPEVGTIEPGKKADVVAVDLSHVRKPYLDRDMPVLDAFLVRATGQHVRLTVVDGRIVYRNGALTTVDRQRVEREAADAALAARLPREIANRDRAPALREQLVAHYRSVTTARDVG